jgi:hypothetical protein
MNFDCPKILLEVLIYILILAGQAENGKEQTLIFVVPGIGMMSLPWARSHARET